MCTHGVLLIIPIWTRPLIGANNYECEILAQSPFHPKEEISDASHEHSQGSMGIGTNQFIEVCFVTTIYMIIILMIKCFERNLSN